MAFKSSPRTGYGIQDFYKTAASFGLARNNTFRIKSITSAVNPNSEQLGSAGELFNQVVDNLLIFVKEGSLPSRIIKTGKVFFKSFEYNVPLDASYPENTSWRVSFYSDKDYELRKFLELWSVSTFDEHSQAGNFTWTTCDIELNLIDYYTQKSPATLEGRRIKLVGCYPVSIGQIAYDNTSTGTIVSVDAQIAFQYIITDSD